jgi:hypothetical protein
MKESNTMNKKIMITLLSTVALTTAMVKPVAGKAEETAGKKDIGLKSYDAANKETTVNLYQSEDVDDYAYDVLQTWFGFSDAQSTGIYKRKNDTIIINVDERTSQKQMPSYTITPIKLTRYTQGDPVKFYLKKGQNIISNNEEGIIHLQNVTNTQTNQQLKVTIQGGINIPRFVLGETTQQEWEKQLQYSEIPGYELVGKNTLITGSSDSLHLIKNPTMLLQKHDQVTYTHNRTHGLDNSSALHRTSIGSVQHLRESATTDTWMYAYYRHIGCSADAMIQVLQPDTQNQWGIYHEMGHTYQNEALDWGELAEVTANIYSLRAEKEAGNRTRLERENVYADAFRYLAQENRDYNSEEMIEEDFIRVVMFWQLELAFGEEFYPNLHKLYREEQADMDWDGEVKQQYFIKSASKVANKNLLPFFEKWGIQADEETKKEIAAYPRLTEEIWTYRDEM